MGTFENVDVAGTPTRLYVTAGRDEREPGVLVLHPWWGLNDDVLAYADRLADAGFRVVAPDMFGGEVATTVEGAERLARGADEEAINAIVLAAADRLGSSDSAAALGFSFGAHWAVWAPSVRDGIVATVLYYGTTGDNLDATRTPVLGHFAQDDPYETTEWVDEFEGILRSAGRDVVINRYPGTGHWFAEPSRDAYRPEAAELAFERTVAFLRQHLAPGAFTD